MKKISLIILTILFYFQSCKSEKNLYIYFDNNSKYANKVRMGKNAPYNYRFVFSENENIDLNLTSDIDLYYGYTKIDTIQLKYLDTIQLKDYNWLKNFTKKYKHPSEIDFYDFFKAVFIVEIDSVKQEAIISKVESVVYEE